MVLTKNDTLALKGIAILLLLWHHMFFVSKDLLFDWHWYKISNFIEGVCSHFCFPIRIWTDGIF